MPFPCLLLVIFGLLLPTHVRPSQRELDLAEKHIHRAFDAIDRIDKVTIRFTAADVESLRSKTGTMQQDSFLELLVPMRGVTVAGYAIIDNVQGKDQPITVLVQFNPSLEIRDMTILAYRESYGGEIRNGSWLDQFRNKKPGDAMRPGKEIRNITGATISARSVTLGVQRILGLLEFIGPRLPGRNR